MIATYKAGDSAYTHIHGVGTFQTPQGVQDGLNAATDEWLLDNLHQHGFVDPFVLVEVMHRGLYAEAERRRMEQAGIKPKTMQNLFDDIIARDKANE